MKKVIKKPTKKASRISFPKSERGVSKTFLLIAVVVILGIVGGGVYVLNSGMKLGPLTKIALNPNCKHNDPDLCKFLNNWQTQRDYSTTTTSTYAGMKIESLTEMSGTDKFHMVSKQNGKEDSNSITIGDTTYTLDYTDNKWWKTTFKLDEKNTTEEEMKDNVPFDEKDGEAEDKTKYTFITKETCGDLTCFKYEILSEEAMDGKQFIWFDNYEYLVRKMTMESKDGSSESIYSYNRVSISVPSPVKEGEPSAPGNSENMPADVQEMMKQYQQSSSDDTSTEQPVSDTSSDY